MNIKKFIPALLWMSSYKSEDFKSDLISGLTVGVMLIPQGMAYAMIAGLPPIYGLYASTIPLIVYALLGSSRQLAVGPVAMVSLLTAAGVGAIATGGTADYIGLAILLAFMVGVIQFLMGSFRLGFLVNFLSHPVISGFTSAAAIIIGLSQLKHLLGIDLPRSQYIHEIVSAAFRDLNEIHFLSFLIGIISIFLIISLKRINKAIPAQLFVVVIGILAVWLLGLQLNGVKIVGSIPSGLPSFGIPEIDLSSIQSLFMIALTIAIIGFMESIAVAKAVQAKHRNYEINSNQELIGLGMSNIVGSFFQSYPVTGGFSRTAVNDQAGAKTGVSSIISAILIALTLLFLTPLFYFLPNAILAGVIIVAVAGLVDWKEAIFLWKANRTDFAMLISTFLSTLLLGIELGIVVGVSLSLIMVIYRTTRPHIAELAQIPGTDIYRNTDRFRDLKLREDLLIIRFDAQLYFANIQYFKDNLFDLVKNKGSKLKLIIIDAGSINQVDSTACHALNNLVDDFKDQKIMIYFAEVKGPVRDAFMKSNVTKKVGADNFFISIQDAVKYFDDYNRQNTRDQFSEYSMQTN